MASKDDKGSHPEEIQCSHCKKTLHHSHFVPFDVSDEIYENGERVGTCITCRAVDHLIMDITRTKLSKGRILQMEYKLVSRWLLLRVQHDNMRDGDMQRVLRAIIGFVLPENDACDPDQAAPGRSLKRKPAVPDKPSNRIKRPKTATKPEGTQAKEASTGKNQKGSTSTVAQPKIANTEPDLAATTTADTHAKDVNTESNVGGSAPSDDNPKNNNTQQPALPAAAVAAPSSSKIEKPTAPKRANVPQSSCATLGDIKAVLQDCKQLLETHESYSGDSANFMSTQGVLRSLYPACAQFFPGAEDCFLKKPGEITEADLSVLESAHDHQHDRNGPFAQGRLRNPEVMGIGIYIGNFMGSCRAIIRDTDTANDKARVPVSKYASVAAREFFSGCGSYFKD